MASRENQGLHIALILFVMITVGLFVTTYLSWSKASENAELLAQKTEALQKAQALSEGFETQAKLLTIFIGESDDSSADIVNALMGRLAQLDTKLSDDMIKIRDLFESDMKFVKEGDEKNWRKMFDQLITAMKTKVSDLAAEKAKFKTEQANWAAEIANAQTAQKQAEGMLATKTEEYRKAQEDFKLTVQNITAKEQESARTVTARANQHASNISAKQEQIIVLSTENGTLTKTVKDKAALLKEYNEESFESADGRITDVVVSSGLVYINVGSLDNLPRLAIFSVYGQDYDVFNKSIKKGAIEVKRIRGSHIAEARITEYDLENPILPGDFINSTTWAPGRKLTFGITGAIDINGDGIDDMMRLKSIVERNGGEVVAYVNPQGEIVGDLTAKTRFLIVGDDPTETKQAASHAQLDIQADAQGVEKMYYHEFLNGMGYRGEASTQGLGARGAEGFKKRRPPSRGGAGAY